jgi:hypothetical protein
MDICRDPSGDYRTRDLLALLRDCSCGKHRILPRRARTCCIRRFRCHLGRIIEFSRVRSAPNIPSIASMLFSAWDLDMPAIGRRAQGKKCRRAYCDVYPPGEPGFGAAGAARVGPEHNSPAGFKARFDDRFAFKDSNSHVAQIVRPEPRFQVFRFPAVRSNLDLHRLHRKIKELFALSHRPLSQMKPANCLNS